MAKKLINIIRILIVLLVLVILSLPLKAQAASLNLIPSPNSYDGKSFKVDLYLFSDIPVNASSGEISFSKELEVISISKDNSIFDLWIKDPSFNESIINFEGIILNNHKNGKIMTIDFKIKERGGANIEVSSGNIFFKENNILKEINNINLIIK